MFKGMPEGGKLEEHLFFWKKWCNNPRLASTPMDPPGIRVAGSVCFESQKLTLVGFSLENAGSFLWGTST